MKISTILNVVLALALVFLCAKLAMSGGAGSQGTVSDEVVYNNILSRVSVRAYQDKAVEKDKVERLLRAGMAAPTAVNKQPWHFVVVTEKKLLAALAETNAQADFTKDAPLAIVVCGDMTKAIEGAGHDFWVQDCAAATENILLAAHAMGLGAVWTGAYPLEERSSEMSKVLKLPETMVPLSMIVIGYPKGEAKAKNKWDAQKVSYNVYGGQKM